MIKILTFFDKSSSISSAITLPVGLLGLTIIAISLEDSFETSDTVWALIPELLKAFSYSLYVGPSIATEL